MYNVYCEEQFIGSFETYEEAVKCVTDNGKIDCNEFRGSTKTNEKEVFVFTYDTPNGDEQLDFIIYFPFVLTKEQIDFINTTLY